VAVEREAEALSLARENRERCGRERLAELERRVGLVHGDLCGALAEAAAFDLAVANLPYVREGELPALDPEVRDHDPRSALVAGGDGLDLVREFARQAASRLAPGAPLLLECAPLQAAVLAAELAAAGWCAVRVHCDRFGRERVVSANRGQLP
jgi:release factor glutamine methyltransferase